MKRWMAFVLMAATALALGVVLRRYPPVIDVARWQRQVSPGPLSASHGWLETSCAACHTSVKGVDATKCIGCHANNATLLQRQPTAFHATIGTCSGCHLEHEGARVRPVGMDHTALADHSLKIVRRNLDNLSNRRLLAWMRQHDDVPAGDLAHPRVTPKEAALDCSACHATKDRHQKLFGADCASCHATATWTISEFQHPSPRSVDCVQCHQAPPSHYMMHFKMVSQAVARAPDARVDQCFRCHQTTSWNDIRAVGWYKHH